MRNIFWRTPRRVAAARRDWLRVVVRLAVLAGLVVGSIGELISSASAADPVPAVPLSGTSTLTWSTFAPMSSSGTQAGAVALPDGTIFVVGGAHGVDGPTSQTIEYEPFLGSWISRASLPSPQGDLAVAMTPAGTILAIGGYQSSGPVAAVEEFDPRQNSWTARAPLPVALNGVRAALAQNGKIYAAGGTTGRYPNETTVSSVEEYDPVTNVWTPRASMLAARSVFSLVAGTDGKLYAIGGDASSAYPGTVEAYDPATNTWSWRASMLPPARPVNAVLGADGRIYAIGGETANYCCGTRVDVDDPTSDSWSRTTDMPLVLFDGTAASAGNYLYALGGINFGGGISALVERGTVCPASPVTRAPGFGRRSSGVFAFKTFLPSVVIAPKPPCS